TTSPLLAGAANTSLLTLLRHKSSPLAASKAFTSPSKVASNTRSASAPTAPDTATFNLRVQNAFPVSRSSAVTRPLMSATYKRSSTITGDKVFHSLPCPTPTDVLHSRFSCTSALIFSSACGFNSFLLELLQPMTNSAKANTIRYLECFKLGILLTEVVEFH